MCLGLGDLNPMYPPTKRGEELKNTLEWVFYAHIVVAIIKICIGGLNNGTGDLFNCMILWCGYIRFDYCQTICYMMMVIQDSLTLAVSLAFWYQKKINTEDVTSTKMEKPES